MRRKLSSLILVVILIACWFGPDLRADSRDDLQVIKKAVKENPADEAGHGAKWFKILITDKKTGKDKVKVTMPIVIVELFLHCVEDKHLRIRERGCEIDLAAAFRELKTMGPMAIVEVDQEEQTMKIWLE